MTKKTIFLFKNYLLEWCRAPRIVSKKNSLNISSEIPFEQIIFMLSKIIYGGRVTDYWDRRIL